MYRKINSDMKFTDRELEILDSWRTMDLSHKLIDMNHGGEVYTVYDGPPTANGKPHIGHVLTRSIKDIIPRYRRMKGYHVEFKAGWDTHGLPVELEVEKILGINGKPQIEEYGIEPFVHQCKKSVWKYKDEWEQISDRLAFSADMEHPYITYENSYIESEWWALRQIWDKGLLYNGYKVVPYCPRCGTALSSHEVAQGYKDVKETSVFVRFKAEGDNTWFAAWTTTPWTLPSNVALCVNPEADYVLLELNEQAASAANAKTEQAYAAGTRYYMAAALAESFFGEGNFEVLEQYVGTDMVGKAYEPIFNFGQNQVERSGKKAFYLVADDYVTLSDGTGIVHIAPAFGEDDARLGRRNNLPFVQLVETDGTMSDDVEGFAGVFCKDADAGLMDKLEADARMLRRQTFEHNYPHCWRCDTPLIYYARNTWFIEMTKLRDRLVANNQTVNWIPENVRDGRFGNFLENVVDWGLSRERYWGTPLPVWRCSCGYDHCIGSIAELKEMSDNCPEDIELHKPYIDKIDVKCPQCGGTMHRVSEVIDGWFDSGAMPFAQYHYPFENKEKFEANFPSDFISEAQDQTRGWFYSLMAISTLLFDKSPYENVIVMGLVQDADGRKMSKHLGNVVDPWTVLNKQGADAVRWYFYHNSQPWLPSRFSDEAVSEGQRKFMGTLWNTLAFYTLYAEIDQFDPKQHSLVFDTLSIMDRWLLAKLSTLVDKVDSGLNHYDITGSARAIQDFCDELSNWYVRRSRERFWADGMEQDKVNAYMTLYTALETLARLSAPFVPYMSEAIYQTVVRSTDSAASESVHLCSYPAAQEEWKNDRLVQDMDRLIEVVQLGRAARNNSGMKNRQPLARVMIAGSKPFTEELTQVLQDELNIDAAEYIDSAEALLTYSFKPQLRTLGKRLGALLPKVRDQLNHVDGQKAWQELKKNGTLTLTVDEQTIAFTEEDLIIETGEAQGYAVMSENGVTVALDLTLSEELLDRGFVREIISKLQNMRKDSGFEVMDRIRVYFEGTDKINTVMHTNSDLIAGEVLAVELIHRKSPEATEWNINGELSYLAVERV